jgi:hypothetical protein
VRTTVIEADGWKITVRGRLRRTAALESEYLLTLKAAHPDMKALSTGNGDSAAQAEQNPKGWSLLGMVNNFRYLIARCASAQQGEGEVLREPFTPVQLVVLFDAYLDSDQLPDRSDLWSKVDDAIQAMDTPPKESDPELKGSTPKKSQS